MRVQTVCITIIGVIVLASCILIISNWRSRNSKKENIKETFSNPDNVSLTSTFTLDDPTFKQTCIKSLVKPTDFRMTNVIHYLKMKEKDDDDKIVFLGPCRHRTNYYVISNRQSINSINAIPEGSTIYYNVPEDVDVFRSIMSSTYNKTQKSHKFNYVSIRPSSSMDEGAYYTNDACNSFDYQSNPLSELLMKKDMSFLLVSFNSLYDDNFHRFFLEDNVDAKLFPLHFTHEGQDANQTQLKVSDTVYNSDLSLSDLSNMSLSQEKFNDMFDRVLRFDTILYTKDIGKMNLDRFYKLNLVDEKLMPLYFDLFDICKLPDKLRDILLSLPSEDRGITDGNKEMNSMENDDEVIFEDSCNPNTTIRNNDGNYNNYVSMHCVNGTSMFIDIIWPIVEKYDISLSSLDLNILRIHSETLDARIPLIVQSPDKAKKDDVLHSEKLESITRFKVNVDPDKHPRDVFLNDIYYGINRFEDIDADGNRINGSLLQNSIPFDFDDTIHEIIEDLNDEEDDDGLPHTSDFNDDANLDNQLRSFKIKSTNSFYIRRKDGGDVFTTFLDSTKRKRSVKLYEGDRVFLNVDTLDYTGDRLKLFLNKKMMQEGENYYHGYVVKKYDETNETSKQYLIIKLGNIRNSFETQEACFDKSWLYTTDDMTNIVSKGQCESKKERTWDVKCKYNYECPFFQKNKNYDNNFGGCNPDGFCEMPIGIYERGFRKYKTDSKNYPICYNCPVGVSKKNCCEEQERAVKLYESGDKEPVSSSETKTPIFNKALKSADYMFEFDNSVRVNKLHTNNLKTCDGSSSDKGESKLYINNFN